MPFMLAAGKLVLLAALAHSAAAQIPDSQSSRASPSAQQAPDPLGRETPRGTIIGFTSAVRRGDFVVAQGYMQLTPRQRRSAETLARDLAELLDRYYTRRVTELSDLPTGVAGDGLPLDRERVELSLPDTTFQVGLVRVADPHAGHIWLISSDALDQVAALGGAHAGTWVERTMPRALLRRSILGVSLAHWTLLAASIAVPLLLLCLVAALFIRVARRSVSDPARRALLDAWYSGLVWPLVLVLTLVVHLLLTPVLGFPLTFRVAWARLMLAVAVVAVAWLMWRLVNLAFRYARIAALRRGQAGARSLLLLGERVFKVIVRLRYGTTAQQLRAALDGIRGLLAAHPRLETETSRIRLVDFGSQAVELELFAYVLTADVPDFLAVREDLLLRVAEIVESSGSAFAQPTEFVYLQSSTNADRRIREAEAAGGGR